MTEPTQEVTTDPQAGQGQQEPIAEPKKTEWTPDAAAAEIKALRAEAAKYRKERETAEKAKADAEAKQAAEQGRYQELYETEKKARADIEAQLVQMQHDQLRRDAAQAAGIPSLWQRLQGSTPEELAEDAKGLAAMMQAPPAPANGQPGRATTPPTPQPQGKPVLTDEERRARAVRTF